MWHAHLVQYTLAFCVCLLIFFNNIYVYKSSYIKFHAVSRTHGVGRGLVLRHSVPHCPPISGGFRVEFGTQRALPGHQRRNEKLNVNEYFISSSGDRTHNQLILQSHFVPLRHDWLQYVYNIYYL